MADTGWSIAFAGWPWWGVLAAGLALGWAAWRFQRLELARLQPLPRRWIAGLRAAACVLVAGLLVEPTLGYVSERLLPPRVAIVVDRSGSMAVHDLGRDRSRALDEAVATGLLSAGARPDAARRAAEAAEAAAADVPRLQAVLAAAREMRAHGVAIDGEALANVRTAASAHAAALRGAASALAGDPAAGPLLVAVVTRLAALAAADPDGPALPDATVTVEELRAAAAAAGRSQAAADAALLAGAGAASPVPAALGALERRSRIERADSLAARLAPVLAARGARIEWFAADEALSPLDAPPEQAGKRATDPGACAAALLRGWAARDNAAAVLWLSDGRQTAGEDPAAALRALAAHGVRSLFLRIGDPEPPRDGAVLDLTAPAEALSGDQVRIEARVRIRGYGDAPWILALDGDGQELERRPVVPAADAVGVLFTRPVGDPGVRSWRVRLLPPDGAAQQSGTQNDAAEAVTVVSDDPVRVLVADATPRWECRHLAAILERDRRVAVDRRYRSVRGSGHLLPSEQAALDAYDAVILGDLGPEELLTTDQQRLADYVAKRGGFLVMVSGPKAMPTAWALGPLADCLPVRAAGAIAALDHPTGLEEGRDAPLSPITAVIGDPDQDHRLWPALPPLPWAVRGAQPKPGSSVLLQSAEATHDPVVVTMRIGAGRVLWEGSDATWRWRDRLGDRVHRTFWSQALRWGLGARLRGREPRLQVALDHAVIARGGSAELRIRARDASLKPVGVRPRVEVVPVAGGTPPVLLEAESQGDGTWRANVAGLAAGSWRLVVTVEHPDLANDREVRELAVSTEAGREQVLLEADDAALARWAAAASGSASDPAGAEAAVRSLAAALEPRRELRRRTWTLWQGPWPLLLITALLTTEWWLRRRNGLP